MKKILVIGMAASLVMMSDTTAYAASWQQNENGRWYLEDNGSYPAGTWKWIDDNHDGISECYYFDLNGYLLTDTTTPDGSQVNSSGSWVVNGAVQTQEAAEAKNTAEANNAYDPNYPLKGMLAQYHLEFAKDDFGFRYFLESQYGDNSSKWAAYNNSVNVLKSELFEDYAARLSGESNDFNSDIIGEPSEKEAVYQVFKDFLNSFDWRNASDKEKVIKAAQLVCQSDYLDNGNEQNTRPYGCLVKKTATCDGFSYSFAYITRLMGMESIYVPVRVHSFNIVKIDGKWYRFDGTLSLASHNSDSAVLIPIDVTIEDGRCYASDYNINNPGAFSIPVR